MIFHGSHSTFFTLAVVIDLLLRFEVIMSLMISDIVAHLIVCNIVLFMLGTFLQQLKCKGLLGVEYGNLMWLSVYRP